MISTWRALIVLALLAAPAACGGARSGPPVTAAPPTAAGPAPAAPEVAAAEPAPPPAGTDLAAPGSPAPLPDGPSLDRSRTAALNQELLSRVSAAPPAEDLPVGPGDLIEVSVFEVEELSGIKVRVSHRGSITLPLVGEVPAAGRTVLELEREIASRLEQDYMYDPQVSVFVLEHRSQRISIIGAVRKGGVYPLTSRLRVADALALAEGLTDDAAHVIYLIRRVPARTAAAAVPGTPPGDGARPPIGAATEEVIVAIDLEALAAGRDELNVPLEAGDVVHVPRAGSYYVGGEVERPGSFFLKSKTTVEQAIMAAGGVRNVADWDDIRIYRTRPDGGRDIIAVSLDEIEAGAPAPEIEKNDVIVVGKSGLKAFFYGVADFFKGIFGFSKGI